MVLNGVDDDDEYDDDALWSITEKKTVKMAPKFAFPRAQE